MRYLLHDDFCEFKRIHILIENTKRTRTANKNRLGVPFELELDREVIMGYFHEYQIINEEKISLEKFIETQLNDKFLSYVAEVIDVKTDNQKLIVNAINYKSDDEFSALIEIEQYFKKLNERGKKAFLNWQRVEDSIHFSNRGVEYFNIDKNEYRLLVSQSTFEKFLQSIKNGGWFGGSTREEQIETTDL